MNLSVYDEYSLPLKILGIGQAVPERIVTSEEIETQCDLPQGWCLEKLGIQERRWAVSDSQSSLGAKAAEQATANAGIELNEIDLIISVSSGIERYLPNTATLIQRRLKIDTTGVPCFAMGASCCGFPMALNLCASFLSSIRYRTILIVSTDVMSKMLDTSSPEAYTFFGDGAAAVVVSLPKNGEQSAIHNAISTTHANGIPYLYSIMGLGALGDLDPEKIGPADLAIKIDIDAFHEHGKKHVDELFENLCRDCDLTDFKLVIPPQAGKVFSEHLSQKIKAERILNIYDRFGFCSSASIPMALYQAVENKQLERGDLFMMLGFGAGLTTAGMIMSY
ncbi:MAG: ketoacyl-ACP synthase III [Desulfobacteraceae bacterium]|jgi:3-oxoacyl-[acyl-carrier-protein] synthase-3